jgi:squalene-hopene/tetraprenyl-beta-curcumene cyclase
MKLFRGKFYAGAILFAALSISWAAEPLITSNTSLRNEVVRSIARGTEALIKMQNNGGYWSTADHPAVTALALVALQGQESDARKNEAMAKGYAFLEKCFQPDGSIHNGKGMVNYNTSISLMALLAAKNPKYKAQIQKTREFLVGTQIDLGEKGKVDTAFDGGVGYGGSADDSDLANTLHALEAIYYANEYLKNENRLPAKDLNWQAAIHFIQSCQNLPQYNKEAWTSDDAQNRGGFIYYPGKSMAGETNINGRVALRSYGSISYSGLLSYIYAELKRDDPRVQAAYEWLQKNFTLDENPGMGPQGIYYYFHTMAKALSAYGTDEIISNGQKINWREKLCLRLLDLQRADGSWLNENGRWWEKEQALVTAYGLLTLEFAEKKL